MLGDDKYTYPQSGGVLRNLLGIEDAGRLDEAVNDFVTVGWAALAAQAVHAPSDVFDVDYLRNVHRELFGDLFSWAGRVRDVPVIAAGADLAYCPHPEIEERLDCLFAVLADQNMLTGLDDWGFASAAAAFWSELTYLHPFRDGNTRTQSFLVSRLAIAAGHPIDWTRINVEHLRDLRIAAVKGFPQNLADYLFDRLLKPAGLDDDPPDALLLGEE